MDRTTEKLRFEYSNKFENLCAHIFWSAQFQLSGVNCTGRRYGNFLCRFMQESVQSELQSNFPKLDERPTAALHSGGLNVAKPHISGNLVISAFYLSTFWKLKGHLGRFLSVSVKLSAGCPTRPLCSPHFTGSRKNEQKVLDHERLHRVNNVDTCERPARAMQVL